MISASDMLSSTDLVYTKYVIVHNTTTDHHHTVQVVRVQVQYLRQWLDEKAPPLQVGWDIAHNIAFDFIGNRKTLRFSQPQALPPS